MRLEYKYPVSLEHLPAIRKLMRPYVNVDEHADKRDAKEYTVRSIYFDTAEMEYYLERIEGISVRKKIRIRGYNEHTDESAAVLEIKRKYVNWVTKGRAALLHGHLADLFRTGDIEKYIRTDNGDARHARQFFYHVFSRSLKPSVLIAYEREAYHSKFNPELRITFDKNLRYLVHPSLHELFEESEMQYAMLKHFVLEVKFRRGLPLWLRQVIKQYSLSRTPVSKYTICLDASRRRTGNTGTWAKYEGNGTFAWRPRMLGT
ncbi:MAG: polyphosphate polymerase domain-containing protein [Candidatus Krumholzibacteria bacterium]